MADETQGAPALAVKAILAFSISNLPSQSKKSPVSGIYAIRNVLSGRVYVGSADSIARRFIAHVSQLRRGVHHSTHLQRAWNKHGENAFEFLILEITRQNLIAREQHFIDLLRPEFNSGPCADNGMRGKRHVFESLKKMSANRKGKGLGNRTFSLAHRAALRAARTDRKPSIKSRSPLSEAVRARMSVSAKARTDRGGRPVEINGVRYAMGKDAAQALGVFHSQIILLIKRGYGRYLDVPSDGAVLKPLAKYEHPKGGRHPGARAVIVDGVRFGSISEAAAHVGLRNSSFAYWLHRGKATYADGGAPPPMNSRYKKK